MLIFKQNVEDVQKNFPKTVEDFMNDLKNSNSGSKDYPVDKTKWVISWAFMIKKANTDEEKVLRDIAYNAKLKLVYSERLKVEIPRIKIDISFKAGKYFRGDRTAETPEFITKMAEEIVKAMMIAEQKELNDPIVIESIQEFIDEFEKRAAESNPEGGVEEEDLDLDNILDKINNSGMTSLTASELSFLEAKSKG